MHGFRQLRFAEQSGHGRFERKQPGTVGGSWAAARDGGVASASCEAPAIMAIDNARVGRVLAWQRKPACEARIELLQTTWYRAHSHARLRTLDENSTSLNELLTSDSGVAPSPGLTGRM